jgi:hypothetical protein
MMSTSIALTLCILWRTVKNCQDQQVKGNLKTKIMRSFLPRVKPSKQMIWTRWIEWLWYRSWYMLQYVLYLRIIFRIGGSFENAEFAGRIQRKPWCPSTHDSWSAWAHIYRKVGWKLCSYHCIFFTLIPKSATHFWECWIVVCRHLHGLCRTRRPALWQ